MCWEFTWMHRIDRNVGRYPSFRDVVNFGGEGGIRTLGTLVRHTRFPVVHNRPLCHLSSKPGKNGPIKEEMIEVVNA